MKLMILFLVMGLALNQPGGLIADSNDSLFPQAQELEEEELMEEEMLEEEEITEEEPQEEEEEEQMQEQPDELQMMEDEPEEILVDDAPPSRDEKMKYYKEKYEENFENTLFEEVWNEIRKAIADENCVIRKTSYSHDDKGNYKGLIVSDYCVFSDGDETPDSLELFSIKVPVIRGGDWQIGRFQYKFVIDEKEDGSVHVRLIGEVSGFESYVTESVHFWESNGYKEYMMLKKLRSRVTPIN